MIHEHLQYSGLSETAAILAKEAKLSEEKLREPLPIDSTGDHQTEVHFTVANWFC